MKAIKITQDLKDKNPLLFDSREVDDIVPMALPNKFFGSENVIGGYKNRTDLHDVDGWKDLITPKIDEQTQRLGEMIEDGDVFIYTVIDLSQEQIQGNMQAELEGLHEQAIQDAIKQKIINEANLFDDNKALQRVDLYPFWKEGVSMQVNDKVRAFDGLEVKLYKVIQAHVTQSDLHPTLVPDLFVEVAPDGQYLVWVQPTGAHDAYNVGDRVWFPELNTDLWESVINANVFSPLAFPQGWVKS